MGSEKKVQKVYDTLYVNVYEIYYNGTLSRLRLKIEELVGYFSADDSTGVNFKRAITCFRDLMLFLRYVKFSESLGSMCPDFLTNASLTLPSILPRSGFGFFLIDMFQLKIICWSDRCIVLDNSSIYGQAIQGDKKIQLSALSSVVIVDSFVRSLCKSLNNLHKTDCIQQNSIKSSKSSNWEKEVIRVCAQNIKPTEVVDQEISLADEIIPFEMVVLDCALNVVIDRFRRHHSQVKPVVHALLEETLENPCDKSLEKLLTFKKSMINFKTGVDSLWLMVDNLLGNDLDMSDLYLSQDREQSDHEEVEILLEGYRSDLEEVLIELRSMKTQIEDANEFVKTYQSETRNRIITFNLHMEIVTLGVTVAACLSSIFGMNLSSRIEDDPYAFYITTFLIIVISSTTILICIRAFKQIRNSQMTLDFPILKEIFDYLDTFELLKSKDHKKALSKNDIGNFIPKFLNKGVNQEELELIFSIFEEDKEALASAREFHHMMHAFD